MHVRLRRRPPFIEYHMSFFRHVAPCPGCSLTYNEAKLWTIFLSSKNV